MPFVLELVQPELSEFLLLAAEIRQHTGVAQPIDLRCPHHRDLDGQLVGLIFGKQMIYAGRNASKGPHAPSCLNGVASAVLYTPYVHGALLAMPSVTAFVRAREPNFGPRQSKIWRLWS